VNKKKRKTTRGTTQALTPKSLGLTDDVKLSQRYNNTRTCFKTVSDVVVGYYVSSGAPTRIAVIYRADIWIRKPGNNLLMTSHEIGDYLNPPPQNDDELPDHDADALASLAASALSALERHAEGAQRKRSVSKTRKKRPSPSTPEDP
jgi:hypothetical protein